MPFFKYAKYITPVLSGLALIILSHSIGAQPIHASVQANKSPTENINSITLPPPSLIILEPGTPSFDIYQSLLSAQEKELQGFVKSGQYYQSSELNIYKEELGNICKNLSYSSCPSIEFLTNKVIPAGIMYPNGIMALNSVFMSQNTKEETVYVLAHELAHNYFSHHKKYAQIFADKIIEMKQVNRLMPQTKEMDYAPPELVSGEEINASSGLVSLIVMRPIMLELEDEADSFAFKYLIKHKLNFNCSEFFSRFNSNHQQSSHGSFEQRCKNYEKLLKLN